MTDIEREALREKQNYLLELADSRGVDIDLQLSADYPGCPTLRELYHCVFPEWEAAISQAIRHLENPK